MFRLGIGALPCLLLLLMQIGFGLSLFQSALVTFASAVVAMFMRRWRADHPYDRLPLDADVQLAGQFGLPCRHAPSCDYAAADDHHPALIGGFLRSLQFTATDMLAYAEIEPAQMSRATTLVSVNQQLALSAGVAVGAFSAELTMVAAHQRNQRSGFRAGLSGGGDHLGYLDVFLLQDAGRCWLSRSRAVGW